MVEAHIPRILHAKSFKYQISTILPLPRDSWQVGEDVTSLQCYLATQDNNSTTRSPYRPISLKTAMQSCWGECNGAVSAVTEIHIRQV
jgi:hypothetical protein